MYRDLQKIFLLKQPPEVFLKILEISQQNISRLQHRCLLVKFVKFLRTPILKNICFFFFLLPLQILLTVIAGWNRRSTNCKAILGLLTDLIFMPISASWNVNQMYYEFPPLKFGKISRNNGHNVTTVEIVNRKNQKFQSSCCICWYIWHHMLHFYICLSGNSPTTVVKR